MEEGTSCCYIASFTPTYLTHSPIAFTLLSQIHRVKRFLSQVRNLMASCGMHAGGAGGTVSLDSSKSKGNFVTCFEWLGTPTLQCNFLFIFAQINNSLKLILPSTLTHKHAWIQTGCCCDFRRRQQWHPWIQTKPKGNGCVRVEFLCHMMFQGM